MKITRIAYGIFTLATCLLYMPLRSPSSFIVACALFVGSSLSSFSQFLVSPENGGLQLPDGFQALVVADNVGRTRRIAVRDNGDIFAALMDPIDLGYVVAMRDTNGDGVMDITTAWSTEVSSGFPVSHN